MGADRTEATKRGQTQKKGATRHPFLAIDHRIIDSPAFADLKPTAQVLLMLLARQLTKDNNGHLQATFSWCSRYGIGSEHTLKAAIADLIAHGFIYRTRSHGANRTWAQYAMTWLPITRREGLFLAGFVPNAWRDWQPEAMTDKKSTPQKVQEPSCIKCSFTPELPAESAGTTGAKTADYESMLPWYTADSPHFAESSAPGNKQARPANWIPAYVSRLQAHGLADFCPVRTTLH